MTELEMIQSELLPLITAKRGEDYLEHICIGEYSSRPGIIGCLEYNNEWFMYINDDRMSRTMFNGPYSAQKCIYALASKLNVYKDLEKYAFDENEETVYIDNLFYSFDDIDAYYKEIYGDAYISPRAEKVKYRYYKFIIGDGIMRRNGACVELLSRDGVWEEKRDLLSKFIGGDCDFDEISEELAMVIADERKAKARS